MAATRIDWDIHPAVGGTRTTLLPYLSDHWKEQVVYQRSRVGELPRCAWHGWEFDIRNGQSWFDPKRFKVRTYPVVVET
jgi:hypothetical protein